MYDGGYIGVGPTSLSSIAPGWKGGKLPPLGGSLGEYSLNDFDEQPAEKGSVIVGGVQRLGVSCQLASLLAEAAGWRKLQRSPLVIHSQGPKGGGHMREG